MVKFCDKCNSIMRLNTTTGILKFICIKCDNFVIGNEMDSSISQIKYNIASEKNYDVLKYDPTIKTINKKCDNCGKEYMKIIRLANKKIKYICSCVLKNDK